MDVYAEIDASIESMSAYLRALSDDIHSHPETALAEHYAHSRLTKALGSAGFRIEAELAGLSTAFRATSGSGRPVVAFLAEYDALPEIGHGCGHNLIATGAVGAALALHQALPHHRGSVQVIGTPGEEGAGGKIIELQGGVFDDVDVAMMFHPADYTVPFRHATAAVPVHLRFQGKASHAAANPEAGRSALAGVLLTFAAIDSLRQFIPETSRIHGIVTDGGAAPNVVPEEAEARFLVRALTSTALDDLIRRVTLCAEGAALATESHVTISLGQQYSERKNNRTLALKLFSHLATFEVTADDVDWSSGIGSSDIGNVSMRVPTIHPYLRVAAQGTPGHSVAMREACRGDDAFVRTLAMTKALARTGADAMLDPSFLASAVEEFRNRGPDLPRVILE